MKEPDDPNRRTKASYSWEKKALTRGVDSHLLNALRRNYYAHLVQTLHVACFFILSMFVLSE